MEIEGSGTVFAFDALSSYNRKLLFYIRYICWHVYI